MRDMYWMLSPEARQIIDEMNTKGPMTYDGMCEALNRPLKDPSVRRAIRELKHFNFIRRYTKVRNQTWYILI